MKFKPFYSVALIFFLLFVQDIKAFTQEVLERKVTLNVTDVKLEKVLQLIEQQTGVKFAYSPESIKSNNKFSFNSKGKPLSEVLNIICKNQNLLYEISGDLIIVSRNLKKNNRQTVVRGKVEDEKGIALIGVSVKIKGGISGTTTDVNGIYSIQVPDNNGILVFSYIGFITQEEPVNDRDVINVTLIEDLKALDEVVIIGYGTQKRENVIGSISQVSAEQIENRPVTQLQTALTGQLPGVTITQNNGRPGTASGDIRVRGVGSFGSDPRALILVDGIPVGAFNQIDPNDVQTITVLKDASSAAIYGARAANGVILVTTKSGKEGKTRVSYNGYIGFQKPTALPEFVNSWEYALAFNEANGTELFNPDVIEKYKNGSDPDNYPNIDFLGAVLSKDGAQTGHNVSVSGGTKTNTYNLSLGYMFQDGVVVKNNYSRYNVRLNMNTAVNSKLDLNTRLAVIQSTINEPMSPVNTNFSSLLDIIDEAARVPNTFAGVLSNDDFGAGINNAGTPVSYLASESFLKQNDLHLNANLRLDYKVINDLKLSFISSFVQENGDDIAFRASQRLNANIFLSPNNITETANKMKYYTLQGLANYTKQVGKHQIGVLAGYSFEENSSRNISAFRDNLPGNDLTVIGVGSLDNQQASGTGSEWALESQFARATYSYANRYLVEGVVRRDGSSRFPANNRYAVFPSVALGWRIGQERFIKNNMPWVSELKIKASRGVLGNQNIGNYPYQNVLVSNGGNQGNSYVFGGNVVQGASRNTLADSTLHWESTRTTDVGIEFGLFNNKLTGSATYFDRYTYDILVSPESSVSNVLGVGISQRNTGKLKNTGWEFTLNHHHTIGKLAYNISSNFSIINNKVLDLGVGNVIQPNGLVGNGSSLFIGYPMQLYYGYVADGLFVDQADIDSWADISTQVNPNPRPGDIRYKDISGPNGEPDGVVDNRYDRTYLGSQIPKYTYGVNLGGNYAGFDFNLLLQGVAGVKGNLTNAFGYAFYNNGNVQRWQYDERWTAENPNSNASYPRLEIINNSGTANSPTSSFWILNGSYLRIKSLQFGYTIPKKILGNVKITNGRFYISAENLKTFSNYRQGWDPEINTGTSFYPILANYTLGVNITL